ncbi:MAG: dimethylarginine dimethylaminohydrolase [Mesorhizobium sp.]|uniref:dimethylarginine dimethylaminohydrolase family protein n=1 Tax=Mesorhizobium sp. TaxID=1871066 RepID=UPI000FE81C0D|nr:dimethylarginine dimethylaminohydrolase [Mesorhizobium sp.]RWH21129.1 MAG: dimethylarginine dimethylaminohydrolase [Mesorhizobium sp.]RWH38665.1 MAG: dimethylarginine dimethylaminohydrolase [Mesorhizobium sp.]TIM70881.1 MAG: dimethylarginine dimethylaminohydrolase [Mesorhizobium sp.]TIO05248.1 MAG: dimethylarginine dimethylaminohydrolase [Mesorhizobium sp.]TIR61904.1 MAG: dimethylarginine dimethylaminohydrolase [Mesorhizobium sp.]
MSQIRSVYEFNSAIVRQPSTSVVHGLRAHNRSGPTYEGVKDEHDAYIAAMRKAGVEVTILPSLESFPDSMFVEDPALVFTGGAILLRPGTPSRVDETSKIAPTLRQMFDTVLELPPPGQADGGDVMYTPRGFLIGLSGRTDKAGAEALFSCIEQLGGKAQIAETPKGVLHFKTASSLLDDETVISTAALENAAVFKGFRQIIVPEGEEPAANVLRVNDIVMVSADYPRTIEMLEKASYKLVPLKTAEIEKIDAGLSCMSLRWYGDRK